MAGDQSYRYGHTTVEVASIDEFVDGLIAKEDQAFRRARNSLLAGVATALAVTAYKNRRR